jgi:hypothetical protein
MRATRRDATRLDWNARPTDRPTDVVVGRRSTFRNHLERPSVGSDVFMVPKFGNKKTKRHLVNAYNRVGNY